MEETKCSNDIRISTGHEGIILLDKAFFDERVKLHVSQKRLSSQDGEKLIAIRFSTDPESRKLAENILRVKLKQNE